MSCDTSHTPLKNHHAGSKVIKRYSRVINHRCPLSSSPNKAGEPSWGWRLLGDQVPFAKGDQPRNLGKPIMK